MTSDITPKFSEEELHGCKSWLLPDVSSNKTLPSAEKEALDKVKQTSPKEKVAPAAGESIEVIEELVQPITADQLQEISEAAAKDGFDSGYEKGLEQGLKEGKEKGIEQGHAEGSSQAKHLVTAQCEQLQHIIDALLIPLETEQNQLQGILLNMVTELAKAVILRDLKLDSSHITQLVDDALNTIPVGADKFSLYLNSQDLNLVEEHLDYLKHNDDKSLILHIDDDLLPGGCRLETQQTVVDYTVEQRIKKVVDGFLHKRFVDSEEHNNDSQSIDTSTSVSEVQTESHTEQVLEKDQPGADNTLGEAKTKQTDAKETNNKESDTTETDSNEVKTRSALEKAKANVDDIDKNNIDKNNEPD